MKKVFALMSIVTMFSMVACGPAKENNEEAEKMRIEDSIRVADSIAAQAKIEEEMAQQQDTTAVDTTMEAPAEAPAEEGHEGHEGH